MQIISPPLISVVMVICNVGRFLAEAIDSVLGQTFRDFEFVILDYGSTDKSREIVLSYAAKDSRIRLHQTPHCTLAEARTAVCSLATGRYIAVQDADDISLPNRLLWEVEFMESHPEIAIVGCASQWINAEGRLLFTAPYPISDEEIRKALLVSSPFVHTSVLMRRQAFAKVGGYRRLFPPAEDYDLYLRLSEHFQGANLEQVAVQYRIHSHQISLHWRRQHTMAKFAAQASAAARRAGKTDPFDSIPEITESLLLGVGVSHAQIQARLFLGYQDWISHMIRAGEDSAALKAALEVLRSDLQDVDRKQVADLRLLVARLLWREKRFDQSLVAAIRALIAKPVLAGEMFASMLRKLRLSRGPLPANVSGKTH